MPAPVLAAPRRGRPRKFLASSRAVTLTLPETVIAALERIDRDLSRAVVRLAQPELRKQPHPPAELSAFGRHAVIVVNPTRTLEQRTGVHLVPLSDGRALIAFDDTMTPARLELKIQDELENAALPAEDARIFASIRDILKNTRRSDTVELRLRQIMVIETLSPPRRRKPPASKHEKETE